MGTYDRVADLPVRIEDHGLRRREREASGGFTRVTTVLALRGEGHVGLGEDVTYDAPDHEGAAGVDWGALAGEHTLAGLSARLDGLDLFPDPPERESAYRYRRWAAESAALDLALRQAGEDLGSALGREYDPVRFVVSSVLSDPPSITDVEAWLDIDPEIEFKLDASPDWPAGLVEDLAATDSVRILDLNGQYEDGTDPDPEFYRRLVEAFPDAIIEDPALTPETRAVLEPVADRVSWDAPIVDAGSVADRPWSPRRLNCKPSRFGTVEALLGFLDRCEREGIRPYGGGQYELGVGREGIHALASLYYPDAPNDVAPRGYNDPEPRAGLPGSPLAPPEAVSGFRWPSPDTLN